MTPAVSALLPVVNSTLHKALDYAPAARARIRSIGPACWRLHIVDLGIDLDLLTDDDRLRVDQPDDAVPDADIRGRSKDFVTLLRAEDKTAALASLPIRVEGNTSSFMQLQSLLSHLDIDTDAWLEDLFGDLAAHQLGSLGRAIGAQARASAASLQHATERYLIREKALLVTRAEADAFGQELHQLRLGLDRLAARVRQLKQGE
ncbi:SCP2 sterol-binding domain-containing protein [Salinispirillum sp. LH 10-3-1]|uniref:SCP2 sterol-binding domain-containing protein n=1 Tax=Salinispirillum sp. LH 10-3-1 TaxID=2952525 RepID=A0AB38YET9_9GAMM